MRSSTTLALAASIALASAQVTYNQTTGVFTCAKPNAAYCAGDSLTTNIIIRCDENGIGHPGNCNDNLAGSFPFGVNFSPCYQTSPTSGEAACSKNCIVYGGSGTISGTFTLPDCIPSATQTTSTAPSTTSYANSTTGVPPTSPPVTTITFSYTTITVPCNTTSTQPPVPPTTSVPSGGVPPPVTNSTVTAPGGGSGGNGGNGGSSGGNGATGGSGGSGSATATPVGPTTSAPAPFTGAAVANRAGALLAAAGFLVAALL